MKRLLCVILAITLVALTGCSSKNEVGEQDQQISEEVPTGVEQDVINPLSEKQYEAFVINESTDFLSFFIDISNEYSSLIIELSDYLLLHGTEIEDGNKGFADFSDYEESLDGFYEFLNGVMYCDSGNIPGEYQEAWSLFKTTVWSNKET